MNCKDAPELVLRAINDGTYDPTEGCRWPRDVIAAYTELSEKTVSRATKQLEAEGRLKVHRPRKRGECNTYFVAAWSPPLRKRTIARLKKTKPVVRRLRESKCPAKRTAASSRARTAVASTETRALLPRCTQFEYQRCGQARESEIRRSRVDQRRRHLHVADLTCLHCTEKDAELEAQAKIIKALQLELNKAMEGEAEWREAAKAAGRATIAAKGQRTKQAKAEARLEQIGEVVAHWRSRRPRTTPEFGDPGTKSFEIIEKALILKEKDPAGPVEACCEAIDGLHIAPWEAYGRRYREAGKGRTLRNSVDYALGDELRIEKCRSIVRWVRGDGADRAWELAQVAGATYWALTELTQERIRERRRGTVEPEPERFTVEGLRVRADG